MRRTLASLALAALFLGITALVTAWAITPTAPVSRSPMPAVAVCAFDGGGMAVAGSVTRTSDGQPWLCTDDGTLIPWHGRP